MRKFTRTKEDFVCKNCNQIVKGNGYTNHCTNCLYSLHVDEYPGDRQENCKGLMLPIDIIVKGGEPKHIIHQCLICKKTKQNILSDLDSITSIIKTMKNKVKKEMMR
jgi:hypothetical protein